MSYIGNARQVLVESLVLEPCNWSAWLDLAVLLPDRDILAQLDLPKCMQYSFIFYFLFFFFFFFRGSNFEHIGSINFSWHIYIWNCYILKIRWKSTIILRSSFLTIRTFLRNRQRLLIQSKVFVFLLSC
jgi:hypothetical protein